MKKTVDTMQQEAIRRMREMEARARKSGNSVQSGYYKENEIEYKGYTHNRGNSEKNKSNIEEDKREQEKINTKEKNENININKEKCIEKKQSNMLDELFKDKEKTLILALIALLYTEKADMAVIFALMYLII